METVVAILMILVCFNFLLKQTFTTRRTLAVTTVVLALFAALMWPLAIEQSKTQIADWLKNTELMRDIAVILTIDVAAQLTFCLFTVRMPSAEKAKPRSRAIHILLTLYPGIIVFPVVFATLVELIFALPGTSFTLIAYMLAAAILAVVPLGRVLLRLLLPENDLRLEMLFLSNVLVAVVGVVATVNGETQTKSADSIDLTALCGFLVLLMAGLLCGMAWYALKQKRNNNINNR